ncbi:hypothetical protein I7I50_01297 [Histoplasma capsulatum G186AR]|uniref:Uncharacterized protein n=1 Tax=Ajellomyces capsulatus TaxID=5037 RepID=A0A8H7YUH4_AJECA|nr:hypothetical protein I7I52_08876 [Histoplasma capsulatum]QSS73212.1 hypothetical protein I7I50_01297 [Histoplasma capsulatum G186AR]
MVKGPRVCVHMCMYSAIHKVCCSKIVGCTRNWISTSQLSRLQMDHLNNSTSSSLLFPSLPTLSSQINTAESNKWLKNFGKGKIKKEIQNKTIRRPFITQ